MIESVYIDIGLFKWRNIFSFSSAENDVEQPSSPSVKKNEEKGIVAVHEVKCKLYVKVSICSNSPCTWREIKISPECNSFLQNVHHTNYMYMIL